MKLPSVSLYSFCLLMLSLAAICQQPPLALVSNERVRNPVAVQGSTHNGEGLETGSIAPNFTLPTVAGSTLRLADLRGKFVLINFWAFWCDTWKEEMPELRDLAERQNELGLNIVAISVDGTRVPEFTKVTGGEAPFPVLLDLGSAVTENFRVRHVPTVFVLDLEGRVRYTSVAWPGLPRILSEISKLVAETPVSGNKRKQTGEPDKGLKVMAAHPFHRPHHHLPRTKRKSAKYIRVRQATTSE